MIVSFSRKRYNMRVEDPIDGGLSLCRRNSLGRCDCE